MGFAPINFMLPWAPLPHNRKRDAAQRKLTETYMDIIRKRREAGGKKDSEDMVWNLMSCTYKNGTPVPDEEVAHMMIALLMAGQHSSSSTAAWIVLRLATCPEIIEELYQEQLRILGKDLPDLTFETLQKLDLHSKVIKETLRIHAPIHSIIRAVKNPMPVEGTPYVIPTTHNVLSSPGVTARSEEYFPEPLKWNPHRWDEDNAAKEDEEDDEKIDYGYGLVSKGTNSPYLPFGAGRHRCIGEQFAYVQLGTILAALVRHFKFSTDGGIPETDYSVSDSCSKWRSLERERSQTNIISSPFSPSPSASRLSIMRSVTSRNRRSPRVGTSYKRKSLELWLPVITFNDLFIGVAGT